MTAYLNGEFLPLSEARISPLDRGFLYADGVYEVVPVYSRIPFRMEEHLRRLQDSLDGIRLANPHSVAEWKAIMLRLIAEADFADQTLYLQITRGADNKRDQAFPKNVSPTVFLFTAPLVAPSATMRENGVAVITAVDTRWARCDLKTVALLANILTRQLSVDVGATETVMIRDGYLTEGSASNIFVVKDGVILTPPKDHKMLPGITYDVVLELAAKHGAPCAVRPVAEAELRAADEMWITSSTKEVLGIATLDGQPVGHGDAAGKPGPVTRQMHAWYCQFRDEVMRVNRGA